MHTQNRSGIRRAAGFSLMELIVVIAVIALLAGVITPMFSSVTQSGKVASFVKLYETLRTACSKYKGDTGAYPYEYQGYAATSRLLSAASSTVVGWKGPYLDQPFTPESNMFNTTQGCHLYATSNPNNLNTSGWDLDGDGAAEITGNAPANVLYFPGVSLAEAREVDEAIDKGVGGAAATTATAWQSTGRVEYIAASSVMLVLVQR